MTKVIKLSKHFVVVFFVFMVAYICNGRSTSSINKTPIKSIKSPDGDTIDCVHIYHQPAFDHPLLKNHTIKMVPSYHPYGNKNENMKINGSTVGSLTSPPKKHKSITQLWHSNGKCPKGTIPIRRTNKEDALRASSLKSYGKMKQNFQVAQTSSPNVGSVHEHAIAYANGQFYGAKATLNLWNPRVEEQNEFSLAQLWILGGPGSNIIDTIEAGWMVAPPVYGDTHTRLFIFFTNDGYQRTLCYNLNCGGFVQTNNRIALGTALSPTSQVDGSQQDITILVWKETKEEKWWLQVEDVILGYWPTWLFSYLRQSASIVAFGGEVINSNTGGQHTTTQMGSGHFPQDGARKASYIKGIQIVDQSNTLRNPVGLTPFTPRKSCYDASDIMGVHDNTGSYFYYGGPGRNPNCP